jgi:hypothetical protein
MFRWGTAAPVGYSKDIRAGVTILELLPASLLAPKKSREDINDTKRPLDDICMVQNGT